MVDLSVRLHPRAKRDAIVGFENGVWKIRVTAPAVENAANEALIALLSKVLRMPKNGIELVRGHHSRNKVVRISGLSEQAVQTALQSCLPDAD